jgi:hypothetical protein
MTVRTDLLMRIGSNSVTRWLGATEAPRVLVSRDGSRVIARDHHIVSDGRPQHDDKQPRSASRMSRVGVAAPAGHIRANTGPELNSVPNLPWPHKPAGLRDPISPPSTQRGRAPRRPGQVRQVYGAAGSVMDVPVAPDIAPGRRSSAEAVTLELSTYHSRLGRH